MDSKEIKADKRDPFSASMRVVCCFCLALLLFWAPFPLGGAMKWAPGIQQIAIVFCVVFWLLSRWSSLAQELGEFRVVALPLALSALVILWAVLQVTPGLPESWRYPLWTDLTNILHAPKSGVISLDPWHTKSEVLKLLSYILVAMVAYRLAKRQKTAQLLLSLLLWIPALYAVYAFGLEFSGLSQSELLYRTTRSSPMMSGPFMLHNSFATFSGLGAIVGCVMLFSQSGDFITTRRGLRRFILSIVQYVLADGAPLVIGTLLCLAAVIGSASRAGALATLAALIATGAIATVTAKYEKSHGWATMAKVGIFLPLFLAIVFSGGVLASRLDDLFATDHDFTVRQSAWRVAQRMVEDSPWLGLGLGTYETAYPTYSAEVTRYVVDKAHCDYLELAAGLGIPGAVALWTAFACVFASCLRGVIFRRRNRVYPFAAIGGMILVALHSGVDFSLQLPAVSLFFAVLLGVGLAQSRSTGR